MGQQILIGIVSGVVAGIVLEFLTKRKESSSHWKNILVGMIVGLAVIVMLASWESSTDGDLASTIVGLWDVDPLTEPVRLASGETGQHTLNMGFTFKPDRTLEVQVRDVLKIPSLALEQHCSSTVSGSWELKGRILRMNLPSGFTPDLTAVYEGGNFLPLGVAQQRYGCPPIDIGRGASLGEIVDIDSGVMRTRSRDGSELVYRR